LDEHGRLENVPFMSEMLQYCGQRLKVFKRADKTCDPANAPWTIRRMKDSVHLEGIRCDGRGHDGCEAGCLIFWKEAWLKRAEASVVSPLTGRPADATPADAECLCTVEHISAASQAVDSMGESVYSCQATELRNFTSHMSGWDLRQYVRDVRSGNLASGLAGGSRAERALELLLGTLRVFQALIITIFNKVYSTQHGISYPLIKGTAAKTPTVVLNLQPDELVQVRSKEEIMATLNRHQRNRGLLFDVEMLSYCGGIYRVLRRVNRIIDEKTGEMLNMKYPCIILEGVACRSDYHRLCPRAIYHYWREDWLRRAVDIPVSVQTEQMAESCVK
jgi:hypothetical protein